MAANLKRKATKSRASSSGSPNELKNFDDNEEFFKLDDIKMLPTFNVVPEK